jgi:hypothetical protein
MAMEPGWGRSKPYSLVQDEWVDIGIGWVRVLATHIAVAPSGDFAAILPEVTTVEVRPYGPRFSLTVAKAEEPIARMLVSLLSIDDVAVKGSATMPRGEASLADVRAMEGFHSSFGPGAPAYDPGT